MIISIKSGYENDFYHFHSHFFCWNCHLQGENTSSSVTYTPTTIDTDGDGLEDGYEIWDFKTLWNTETSDSTEANPIYEQDSDEDELPDGYEVFTLGTDPAVANASGTDSDNDGLTDIQEYNRGTDPWLRDSDFDNTSDQGDSTPRKTNGHTRQTVAAAANVHIGMYDREYSETEEGVTYTYIKNIYRGEIKKTAIDYGDSTLNKTMKYFYDAKGNNTAIVEQYDETYDPNHTQTICITYTYDADNNVTFICDQWTKYTMTYSGNNMTSLKVGNQELIQYADTELVNNAGANDDISNLSVGDVINRSQNITTHGNGQSIKTITTTYKVAENDTTSVATEIKIYYGNGTQESYKTTYNIDGSVLSLTDYTQDTDNPIIYTYTYTDNTTSVSRSDGFTKSVQTSEDEDTGASTTSTSYGFTDVKGNHQTYTSSVTASMDEENNSNILLSTLYNNDTYRISTNEEDETQVTREKLHSDLYDRNILKTTQTINSNTSTSYAIDIYAEDKDIDYTYDLTGNITEIKIGNDTKYRYSYDAHGRLTNEKDYVDKKQHIYNYNETGNIQGKTSYNLDDDGNRITSSAHTVYSEYNNTQWPDQLTKYDNQTITYDNSGNPLNYIHGMQFTWDRGRQLTNILLTNENNDETDDKNIVFWYNDSGLRTYKDTEDTTTVYEWDDTNLIRETVTYKATNKTYDIWYFYDGSGNAIGYEYSYINEQNQKSRTRIYYEKDLQGNVIGLLDARGAEIATYAYDAWGNITRTVCYEGYETAYNLNHITYRSYYRDDETGFYYLQSRYYDPEICRFINADDEDYDVDNDIFSYNKYIFCRSNPIKYTDYTGKSIDQQYTSSNQAAKKCAEQFYGISSYIRFELSCIIYGKIINSKMYYYYTNYTIGQPHACNPLAAWRSVPKNGIILGVLHTHPNSDFFSKPDLDFAHYTNYFIYVVTPSRQLKLYHDTRRGYREETVYNNLKIKNISRAKKISWLLSIDVSGISMLRKDVILNAKTKNGRTIDETFSFNWTNYHKYFYDFLF